MRQIRVEGLNESISVLRLRYRGAVAGIAAAAHSHGIFVMCPAFLQSAFLGVFPMKS